MKSIFRKAILVILALVIFAVSVYAWSYVQNAVDVNGIKVQPSGTGGIEISKKGENSFSAQVNASTVSAITLTPVSTYDLENWFVPSNIYDVSEGGAYSGTYSAVNSQSDASKYYYSESFEIKTTSNLEALIVNNITVNSAGKNISKALRVGIAVTGGDNANKYIFAPVSGHDANYDAITNTSGGTQSVTLSTAGKRVISPLASDVVYTVTVFVWYEGQDSNCTTENLKDAEALEISIEFSGVEY